MSTIKNIMSIFMALIFILPLIVHAYLGIYNRFIADDYCSAAAANSMGIFDSAIHSYLNWSGRYSANILNSLVGYAGPKATPYVTASILLVWISFLVAFFFKVMQRTEIQSRFFVSSAISSYVLSAILVLTPDVRQSLHWGQGMRSVLIPIVLFSLLAWLVHLIWNSAAGLTPIRAVLIGIIIFISGGFSETYAAVQLFGVALLMLFLITNRHLNEGVSAHYFVAVALASAALSFLVVLIAPGNGNRQSYFPPNPGPILLLQIASSNLWNFLIRIINDKFLFANCVTVMGVFMWVGFAIDRPSETGGISRSRAFKALGVIFLMSALMIFSCFVPAAYAMSSGLPARTQLIPTFVLVCALAVMGFTLGKFDASPQIRYESRRTRICKIFTCLLLGSMIVVSLAQTKRVFAMRRTFYAYARAWDRCDRKIRRAKERGHKSITVPPIRNKSGLEDVGSDPANWVNQCLSNYYGIDVRSSSSKLVR